MNGDMKLNDGYILQVIIFRTKIEVKGFG